jgi:hypothetical protein
MQLENQGQILITIALNKKGRTFNPLCTLQEIKRSYAMVAQAAGSQA